MQLCYAEVLPSVIWRCWLGSRKGIWPVKKLSGRMLVWLSGLRCRFAYGLAEATATHYVLLQWVQTGFTFLVLPFWYRLTQVVPDKIQKSRKTIVCVCVCVSVCVCVCIESPIWGKKLPKCSYFRHISHFGVLLCPSPLLIRDKFCKKQ